MSRRELLGVGAAACVACCVPLIVSVLGAVAAGGVLGGLFLGVGGLVVASVAIGAIVLVRRGRPSSCDTQAESRVELGRRS